MGRHACEQTLQVRPQSIQQAYICEKWEQSPFLKKLHLILIQQKIPIQYKHSHFLKGWQGLALDCTDRPHWSWQILQKSQQMVLVAIDSLEDPQNLGSILRSSWLLGVYGILLCKHHSVHLTPHVHKVASGAVEHVPIEIVTNLSTALSQLKDYGFWVYGLGTPQEKGAKPLWNEDFPKKVVLIVGAEGKGLHRLVQKTCDQILTIPQTDPTQSLNASMSLGIALYEIRRFHSK